MSQPKNRSRKHLSIPDLYSMFATKQVQVDFFFQFKWPDGFVCPVCGCTHYSFSSNRQIYECKRCHHQSSLKSGTILENSKLSLFQWILILYFICDSTTGISALELSRKVGIGVNSATLCARKVKFAMLLRNDLYRIFDVAEHDEIYIGAPSKNGKRGLGTDKQLVFVNVGIENNIYPTYLRLDMGEKHTTEATLASMRKCVESKALLKTDGKTSYPRLSEEYTVEAEVNDYVNRPDHLHWLNTITSNLKTFIQGTYHGIAKRYLCFSLSEFEWRFNRRSFGVKIMDAAMRTIMSAPVMKSTDLITYFDK